MMSTLAEQLELLVDGELDETQRTQLLGSLDAEPDGWKQCVFLFLEDQALRQFFKNDTTFKFDAVIENAMFSVGEEHSELQIGKNSHDKKQENPQSQPGYRSFFRSHSLVTLASCLLLGIAAGFLLRSSFGQPDTVNSSWANITDPATNRETNEEAPSSVIAATKPESQFVSLQTPMSMNSYPVETVLPQAVFLISRQGETLVPQNRMIPLRPDSPSEQIIVPCFSNHSVDPNAFSKLCHDTSRHVKNRSERVGKNICHKFSYQIVSGSNNELILIPMQDTIIHYDEIGDFK